MSEQKLNEVIRKAATDLDFRHRLIKMPRAVLMEEGFDLPADKKVVILESTDDLFYFILPPFEKGKEPDAVSLDFKIEGNTVFLSGRLDASGVEQIRETLLHWQGSLNLNLKDLTYISSAGLGLFLMVLKELKKSGHEMHLSHLQSAVRNVFVLGGFDKIFHV